MTAVECGMFSAAGSGDRPGQVDGEDLTASSDDSQERRWRPPHGLVWGAFLFLSAAFALSAWIRGLDFWFTVSLIVLLAFSGWGAVWPTWRYAAGEALLGSSVLLIVITYVMRDSLTPSIERVVGAVMLAVVGVIQLNLTGPPEDHPR